MDTETLMTSAIGKVSIMMIMQNNEHTNFIWLHTGCSDKLLLKFSRLPQGAFTIDTLMNGSTGTGCAERWCTALLWGYSEPVWALCCTTCSGEPALAEGVEWDLQRTPPASTNPWYHIFHRQEIKRWLFTQKHPFTPFFISPVWMSLHVKCFVSVHTTSTATEDSQVALLQGDSCIQSWIYCNSSGATT